MSTLKIKAENRPTLAPSRLTRVGVMTGRTYFRAVVENDTTREDIEKPDFWSLVATQFVTAGQLPRIEIVPDDMSWLIDGVILSCGKTHAIVRVLNETTFDASTDEPIIENDDGLRVSWGGPHSKFRVLNRDGGVVKDGIPTKEEANIFLKSHRKAITL